MYNIGFVAILAFNTLKAYSYGKSDLKGTPFLVNSLKGFAIFAKLGLNYP